jgi:hypothetical protein
MNKHIKDVESFNIGLQSALDVLRQHFFAGNLDGANNAILQIERMIVPISDNGVYDDIYIPDSVKEEFVPPADLMEQV